MSLRVENWRVRLLDAMDIMEREPHVYGQSDCLMRVGFLAAAELRHGEQRTEILAMLDRYRGRYSTLRGAYRVLAKDNFTPLSLVAHFFQEQEPVKAHEGDIGAACQDGRHWGFGVIVGPHFYVSTETGTGILPRSAMQKSFRVD